MSGVQKAVYFVVFYETHMVRTRKSFRGANSWSFRCIWEVYKIKTTCDTCIYIYRYDISVFKIGQLSTFAKLSRRCLSVWSSPSFRPAFANAAHMPMQWIITGIQLSKHELKHGSLNVPIEHHPTIRYMVYNGYYKVMSNIPKMGQLPTPVKW